MRKMGLLVMALVMAMGAMGLGYAMWSETLTITGTVNTGEVEASFTGAFTDDDGTVDNVTKDVGDIGDVNTVYDAWGEDSSDDPTESAANADRGDKDVAKSTATGSGLTGTVTITNGYPCYYTTAYFTIENSGTIPLDVLTVEEHCSVKHWTKVGDGSWVERAASDWYEVTPCEVKYIDFGTDDGTGTMELDEEADLAVHITGIVIGSQVDPGDTILMDVDIHVEQGAAEEATYTFDERVKLVQWNEGP